MLLRIGFVLLGNSAPLQDSWVGETFGRRHREAGLENAEVEGPQAVAVEDKAADTFLGQEGQGAGE